MEGGTLLPPPAGTEAEVEGEIQQPAVEMEGETQQPAAELDGENQSPPAEMEGETQPPPAKMENTTQQPAAEIEGEPHRTPLPACVYKVLDDDDLLTEIIVRVGFPTSLVHAAAVCRRWLLLASDRAFLRRFRKLHPSRLLGFYIDEMDYPNAPARFFPVLPQPSTPELAAVVRRASFSLDTYKGKQPDMEGCWNGRVVTRLNHTRHKVTFVVHSPLCSERGMAVIPALQLPFPENYWFSCSLLFSKEENDVLYYFYVNTTREGTSVVQVFMLRNGDDAWRTHLTLTVDYIIDGRDGLNTVLAGNKIYMASARNEIFVLDLTASSFSTIQLPQGVDFLTFGTTMLSRADDASAVYLIHATELQLHIWLHKGGNWLLVDNICLREMCAPFLEDQPTALLQINHEGDYTAEFLFLEMGRFALYLDVKCRTLRKVYETTREDQYIGTIFPFMMIWPPIFPALKDAPASNAT